MKNLIRATLILALLITNKNFSQEVEVDSILPVMLDEVIVSTPFGETADENVIKVTKVIDGVKQDPINLESEEFEQYRQSPEEERANDIVDFSDFDYVTNPVPLESTIKIMTHAYNDVNSKVAIITAEKFFKPKFPASFKPAKVKGI